MSELSLREKEALLLQARRWIISYDKSMAGISIYAESMILDQGEDTIAATDGNIIYYGDEYFGLANVKERAAVTVHEILHVAFRHPQRRGTRHPQIWNIAVDAVVNAGLAKLTRWLTLPGDHVTFEKIIDPHTLKNKPGADWTSEAVYEYLYEKAKDNLKQALSGLASDEPGNPDKKDKGRGNATLEDMLDELAKEIEKRFPHAYGDLLKPKKEENPELESRKWERRLQRAVGSQPDSVLAQLLKEFPKSELPWESLLRQYMKSACLPKTTDNWARPGRQMLSTGSRIFTPGIKAQNGLQRAVVIVDTSGSIYGDPKALNAFASEITAIQKQTGCIIELVYADAAVAATYTIKNDGKSFTQKLKEGKHTPKGGGGTNFIPAVELARTYKPAVVIYLTDGEGKFPSTTYGMNLLWVITTEVKAPVGKTIKLNIPN